MLGQSETIKDFQFRFPLLYYSIVLMFLLLSTRLVYLQIYQGQIYRRFSQENSLRKEKIPGPRGQIFDRNNRLLVDNRLQLDITLTPQFAKNAKAVIARLAELSGESSEKLYERYAQRAAGAFKFQPVTVMENAPWPTIVRIESSKVGLAGVEVESRIRRTYLDQQIGSHLFGYLSEVTKKDIEDTGKTSLGADYSLGDWIGRSGLERRWERFLKGVDGVRFVEVDAHGHRVGSADDPGMLRSLPSDISPKPGDNLILTIDEDYQKIAAEAMKGKMGAVVALDPRTGEVLTMLSQPSFDPTEMGTRGPELWQSITKNPYSPLRNKSIQDHFSPGSTFKIFTALAALDAGIITENTEFNCPGFFKFGNRVYHCDKRNGHGHVALHDAIVESCDVYFYNIAARLGIDVISKMAENFGFGERTGVELANEVPGLMPSEAWKQRTYHQEWTPGETLSSAIGQGYDLVTPLQLARAYSTLVNGGNLYRPYLVSRIEDVNGKAVKRFSPQLVSSYKINPKFLNVIKEGLFGVVNDPRGTAYPYIHTQDSIISGKTGTVQVMSFNKDDIFKPCHLLPYEERHHAWFVGYAPRENPEIVVAALGMHECGGGRAASPVVKAVIDKWFEKKREADAIQGPHPASLD